MEILSVSLYSILFGVAIIAAIAGVILLLVGLINDNKKMWIPGIIGLGIGIIVAAIAIVFSVMTIFDFAREKAVESLDYVDMAMDDLEEGYDMDDYNVFLDKGYNFPESKYFYVCENYRQTFFYMNKDIQELQLLDYAKASNDGNGLALKLNLKAVQSYNKSLKITVFDTNQEELGYTNITLSADPNTILWSDVDFSAIEEVCSAKYFTLDKVN